MGSKSQVTWVQNLKAFFRRLPRVSSGLETWLDCLRYHVGLGCASPDARSPARPNISQSPLPGWLFVGQFVLKGLSGTPIIPEYSLVFQKCPDDLSQLYPPRIWRSIFTGFQLDPLRLLFFPSGAPTNLVLGEQDAQTRNQGPEDTHLLPLIL